MSGIQELIERPFKKFVSKEGIVLKVNGNPYKNFISAIANRQMDAISGSYDFVATIDSFKNFPIKIQDKVVVEVNGTSVVTGFIEDVEPSYTSDSHQIRLSGRDRTTDVITSSIKKPVSFKEGLLRDIIFKLLNNNGIPVKNIKSSEAGNVENQGFIGIIDLAEPEKFNKNDIQDAVVGENLFEVINKYCKKRQVLASTDGFANIVLTRASKKTLPIKLIHKDITRLGNLIEDVSGTTILTRQNNVLSGSARFSTEDRFNSYTVISQSNITGGNNVLPIPSSTIVSQSGIAIDEEIRKTRSLVISADTSNTSQTAEARAIWEANVRRARSQIYTCTVQGFSIKEGSDQIWEPNRLVQVEDDKTDIDSELLIRSVSYSFNSEGSKTKMELITPDAFTLEANQKALEARSNKFGLNI